MSSQRHRPRRASLAFALLLSGCRGCVDEVVDRLHGAPAPAVASPSRGPNGATSVTVPGGALLALTAADLPLLERHLRSSAAWSVFVARGKRYAARRRQEGDHWVDGSNGFHSRFDGDMAVDKVIQSRVLLGLDGEHGFGERGVTHAKAGDGEVRVALSREDTQPGDQSYLVVTLPSGITVEIHEQAEGAARSFTAQALAALEAEVAEVLTHRAELDRAGFIASLTPPGSTRLDDGAPKLVVEDDLQGGIYGVQAWINPGARGVSFLRVSFTGQVVSGDKLPDELHAGKPVELSAERVLGSSARLCGWSADPRVRFRYDAGATIYEGDWEHRYEARFELWFRGDDGKERRLAETTRRIQGWQR